MITYETEEYKMHKNNNNNKTLIEKIIDIRK